MVPPLAIARDLDELRELLDNLPALDQFTGFSYPFQGFSVDDKWTVLTGSIQGSVNHSLEVAFGSRANTEDLPIKLKSHGPDLVAVVDVLAHSIDGKGGENPILIKWISDLKAAAIGAYNHALAEVPVPLKRPLKATSKREIIELEVESKIESKRQKVAAKAATEKAKARTQGKFNFNPENLQDVSVALPGGPGRRTLPLLDKLTIPCKVVSDPSLKPWRCAGPGCQHYYANPRGLGRVQAHAMVCTHLSRDLVEEALSCAADKALGTKVDIFKTTSPAKPKTIAKPGTQPSVYSEVHKEGLRQRSIEYNYYALLTICTLSFPPSIIDSYHWEQMVGHLDPDVDRKSGSHISGILIPAEAARSLQESYEALMEYRHLTLSFDGATTRRNQSIYTVHVTTPDTRQAHLLAGNEATGVSHTGEHIKQVLLKAIGSLGFKRFSAVSSDSTGNTRLARELLAGGYPCLIILPDPCHQMNNTAKDMRYGGVL